jgi:hypothetical protein
VQSSIGLLRSAPPGPLARLLDWARAFAPEAPIRVEFPLDVDYPVMLCIEIPERRVDRAMREGNRLCAELLVGPEQFFAVVSARAR